MEGISVVVPAYNEQDAIEEEMKRLRAVLEASALTFEIIVVDDGSSDETRSILDEVKGIRLIRHAYNRGYGAALKTGIRAAQFDVIAITDADGTYPHERIPDLAKYVGQHDMAVGARTLKGAKIPVVRRPAKWMINQLANYLCECRIPDPNSGLRVMRKDILMEFFNILPEGFSFTTTITVAMLINGHSVEFVPIDYHGRKGKSKIRPIRDTLNFVQLIIRTVMYFRPLKVFVPLSIILFMIGLAVLLYSFFFTPQVMDITTIVFFLAAIHMLSLGMLSDLIDKRMRK